MRRTYGKIQSPFRNLEWRKLWPVTGLAGKRMGKAFC